MRRVKTNLAKDGFADDTEEEELGAELTIVVAFGVRMCKTGGMLDRHLKLKERGFAWCIRYLHCCGHSWVFLERLA